MGWPRKHEEYRLYLDRKDKTYILVSTEMRSPDGCYSCVQELMKNNDPEHPKLTTGKVSDEYIRSHCRRVSWNDLPAVWQREFMDKWFDQPPKEDPRNCRGLWRIGEEPYARF